MSSNVTQGPQRCPLVTGVTILLGEMMERRNDEEGVQSGRSWLPWFTLARQAGMPSTTVLLPGGPRFGFDSTICVSLKHTERLSGLNKQQGPKKLLNTKPEDIENILTTVKKGSNQPNPKPQVE